MFSEIYVRKDVFLDMGAKMKEYSSSQEEVVTEGVRRHIVGGVNSTLL